MSELLFLLIGVALGYLVANNKAMRDKLNDLAQ